MSAACSITVSSPFYIGIHTFYIGEAPAFYVNLLNTFKRHTSFRFTNPHGDTTPQHLVSHHCIAASMTLSTRQLRNKNAAKNSICFAKRKRAREDAASSTAVASGTPSPTVARTNLEAALAAHGSDGPPMPPLPPPHPPPPLPIDSSNVARPATAFPVVAAAAASCQRR